MVVAIQQAIPFQRNIPIVHLDDLAKRVQVAMHRWRLFQNPSRFRAEFERLTPEDVKQVIEQILEKEPSIEELSRFIPLEKLEAALRLDYPNLPDALTAASLNFRQAKNYLDRERNIAPTLKTYLSHLIDAILSFLETLTKSLGIADFFRSESDAMKAEFKGQKVMMLLGLFSTLTMILAPIIGAGSVSAIVGGSLLAITVLSILFPYIKPTPHQLPQGENWSLAYRDGKLDALQGRKNILDQIAQTLKASDGAKTHPMLIGKSGVGKTETIKAFVQAIEKGDYPELKGKQVIYFNSANLVHYQELFGAGNKIIERIVEEMGSHSDKFILVFDEIHEVLKVKEGSAIGEQLKTRLDPGNGNFPHVIGITTEQEYYEYVKPQAAFDRRFKQICLENTEDHETLEILSNTLINQSSPPLLAPNALHDLLTKTKQAFPDDPQPLMAQKILMQCIGAIGENQKSDPEKAAEKIRSQLASLYAQGAALPAIEIDALNGQIQPLVDQLAHLRQEIDQIHAKMKKIASKKKEYDALKKRTMEKVVQIGSYTGLLSTKNKEEVGAMLLMSRVQAPYLEKAITAIGDQIGFKTAIDAQLIDRMITEEQENRQKIDEARNRGAAAPGA